MNVHAPVIYRFLSHIQKSEIMLPQAAKMSLHTKVMEAMKEEMKFNRGFEDG